MSRYPPKKPAAKAPAKKVVKQKGKLAAAKKRSKPRKVLTSAQREALAAEERIRQRGERLESIQKEQAKLAASTMSAVNFSATVSSGAAKRFRFRDAITGLFVRARDALRRKHTTVRERI